MDNGYVILPNTFKRICEVGEYSSKLQKNENNMGVACMAQQMHGCKIPDQTSLLTSVGFQHLLQSHTGSEQSTCAQVWVPWAGKHVLLFTLRMYGKGQQNHQTGLHTNSKKRRFQKITGM